MCQSSYFSCFKLSQYLHHNLPSLHAVTAAARPSFRILQRMSSESSGRMKPALVLSLQKLCMTEYLLFLESSCASYIQLTMMDNPLLRNITKNMLPVLKDHVESSLPAPAGNFAREEMVTILLSGKYPSPKIRKAYIEDLRNVPDDPGSHDDRARHNEIREHGKGEEFY